MAELAKLLELFSEVEERGGCASLSLSTSRGKSTFKFTLETPPSPATTLPSSSASPSAPGNQAAGRRRRNRGAAWRARNQRAAASQVTLAEVNAPPASPPPRPPRPLHHLLSPSPSSGRRRVMSLGRPEMPTFSSLNLDGASSPSPTPTPPTPSSASPPPSTPSPSPPVCYRGCTWHCDSCENTPSCVEITLAAPAVTRRTFHLIVQCVAAFEMLWTAHLLISNDLFI